MLSESSEQYESSSNVIALYRRVPNDQKGLEEFEIDLEGSHRQYIKSFFGRRQPKASPRIRAIATDICLVSTIFILPNAAAATMAYFYVFSQLDPTSQISAALHATRVSWLVFQIALPLVCICASLANLLLLIVGVKYIARSVLLMFLALIVACIPLWCPYVVEAAMRLELWNNVCNGYDANIFVQAVHYNSAGFSYAQFPDTMMAGAKWQIYQNVQGIYEFGPVDGASSEITYNFRNDTYILQQGQGTGNGHLTDDDSPLSFPAFGLYSNGSWIRSCSAPAVNLYNNATGNIAVKTGLSAYTDCSKMEICAMTGEGLEGVLLAVGRILIALEQAAQCCTRTKYS